MKSRYILDDFTPVPEDYNWDDSCIKGKGVSKTVEKSFCYSRIRLWKMCEENICSVCSSKDWKRPVCVAKALFLPKMSAQNGTRLRSLHFFGT